MKSLQDYTIVIRPDDNGTFVAYVPAIIGCHAWGRTLDEARTEVVYVFEMIQQEYEEQGRFAEFEKIEAILEDYALAKLMEEVEDEEPLSREQALQYYQLLTDPQA